MKTFIQFLREYNRDTTLQVMGDELKTAAKTAQDDTIPNLTPVEMLKTFEAMDRTPNKQYVMWLIREYKKQQFKLKDTDRLKQIKTLLAIFDQGKAYLQKKDINQYTVGISTNPNFDKGKLSLDKEINNLLRLMKFDPKKSETDETSTTDGPFDIPDSIKKDVTVLHNDKDGLLAIPKTKEASRVLGCDTDWCTASEIDNRFDEYNRKGPLYIWLDERGKKYQFHFETGQYMDANDQPINSETLKQFRTEHPVLKDLFSYAERRILKSPERVMSYVLGVIKGRWPEGEPVISKDPKLASEYARDVIKGRWPEAELVILKNPRWASFYAIDVINGRWPEAERTILTDPYAAYVYARMVIEGRWPEAEPVLSKDPEWASTYALFVIKGRWPEAERTILTDPKWASMYARDVIKGRWPEAEPVISKDPKWASMYARDVIKGPWPEADAIAKRNS